MAYVSIPSTWYDIGKAIKKQLVKRISDNLTDHETRINGLEAGSNKVEIFNFEVIGYINNYTAAELVQIGSFRAPSDMTITEVKLILMNSSNNVSSSTSGVLSIDLQKSTDNGLTWNTVLSGLPEIADGVNTTGTESALVTFIPSGEDLLQDDMLRVNVTTKKDTQGSFMIVSYGDVA